MTWEMNEEEEQIAERVRTYLEDVPIYDETQTVFVRMQQDELLVKYFTKDDQIDSDQTQFEVEIKGNVGYINFLFVEEGLRRKGYGSELYNSIRDFFESEGCDKIALTPYWQAGSFWSRADDFRATRDGDLEKLL